MHEPNQLELFQEKASSRSPTVQYVAPEKQVLRSYAQAITHALVVGGGYGVEKEQSNYVSGLSNFLDVVTRIQASALSKKEESHEK